MLPPLTDDPFARRRELAVVLELCAAWERGQSAAAVPKSYPGTEIRGIGEPMTRSITPT